MPKIKYNKNGKKAATRDNPGKNYQWLCLFVGAAPINKVYKTFRIIPDGQKKIKRKVIR